MSTKWLLLKLGMLATLVIPNSVHAKDLGELKVLYLGLERTTNFVSFLTPKVAHVEARQRAGFKVADAEPFDVVLLDWPQGADTREMRKITSPLGQRDQWHKPTVLLGSAGLNLAVSWQMKGGSGCTCMDPLAYGLRDHEIFERPFKIERKMIRIPTPPDFKEEIKEPEIEVLPLVDDPTLRWHAGWCTYSNDFARNPDVEFFCGGVNHKTPTAAGLWRQGNLLHFGFEQSPPEMNETGQQLLLNAIVYISRFSEDRPIATTPSVFAGPIAVSRAAPAKRLRNAEYKVDWVRETIAPELWAKFSNLPRPKMAEWLEQHSRFLHPNASLKLEIDEDLEALGVPFDQPEFFDRTLAGLREGNASGERARRLLERYVPCGPKSSNAEEWAAWWHDNQPYAFASDIGLYCWYVDPLAKKRGVPAAELRGPKRADAPS